MSWPLQFLMSRQMWYSDANPPLPRPSTHGGDVWVRKDHNVIGEQLSCPDLTPTMASCPVPSWVGPEPPTCPLQTSIGSQLH